jgi:hypothetical protein
VDAWLFHRNILESILDIDADIAAGGLFDEEDIREPCIGERADHQRRMRAMTSPSSPILTGKRW